MSTPKDELNRILDYAGAIQVRLLFRTLESIALDIQQNNLEELWQQRFETKADQLLYEAFRDLEVLGEQEFVVNTTRSLLRQQILEIFNQV